MIYLDNSATTRCSDKAFEMMKEVLLVNYGNPSSLHDFGVITAGSYIKNARAQIADTLKANPSEIFFTSGGTEGNNLAICGSVMAKKRLGNHIITTKIEHASVANPFKELEKQGFEVIYLGTDEFGVIKLDELDAALRDDTIFVSIMMVNNEIGSIQPIDEAAKLIRKKSKNAIFHVDAIQAYGKVKIIPKKMDIDILTVSGHKIHGPKGSGFIYIKKGLRVVPQILGGGQEDGMRSGTENVPAIAGLGVAAKDAIDNLENNASHMYAIRERFISGLSDIAEVKINGHLDNKNAPHIVSVSVKGARSRAEVMLHTLESDYNILVSAGSACSSHKRTPSATLTSIGLDKALLDKTIRFSFCPENTEEEIDEAIRAMHEIVPKLLK